MRKNGQCGDRIDRDLAILEAVTPPGRIFTCREIEQIVAARHGTIGEIERRAIEKVRAKLRESGVQES